MKFKAVKFYFTLFLFAAGFFVAPGHAAIEREGQAVSEVDSIAPGRPFWIAIYVDPEPGSSVAWVDLESGDRGLGVNMILPPGLSKGELIRPVPMPLGGHQSFGHPDAFWVLQEILVDRSYSPDGTQNITGRTYWYECAVADCYDSVRDFRLTLAAGAGQSDPKATDIFSWSREGAPSYFPWPVHYRVDEGGITFDVFMKAANAEAIQQVFMLPNLGMGTNALMGNYEITRTASGLTLKKTPEEGFMAGLRFEGLVYITTATGTMAYLLETTNLAGDAPGFSLDQPGLASMTLWLALGLAFIGGLLLNLMPCVFPVLALKVFGVIKAGSVSAGRLRADALAYTGGILLSFILVALVLLTVRGMGQQVGWGFQLQSPYFISALTLVLFLVGLSFAGAFHMRLPFALSAQSQSDQAVGSFYTGMLATLVATPCTAPFMAPALGFALGLPTLEAIAIFLGLGLGLAAPYLIIGFWPGAARIFPKPGPWMETFRKLLVVPIAATIGWLLWVLYSQVGKEGLWVPVAFMAVAGAFLFILKESRKWPGRARPLALAVYALSAVALVQITLPFLATPVQRQVEAVEFSEDELWNLRLQGKGVFVNYTATWCITCLVNERMVLSKLKFQQFLIENNIVYMEADWTSPDAEIALSLEGLGRTALPVYAYYPPGGPTIDPILLPEILTIEGSLEILASKLP